MLPPSGTKTRSPQVSIEFECSQVRRVFSCLDQHPGKSLETLDVVRAFDADEQLDRMIRQDPQRAGDFPGGFVTAFDDRAGAIVAPADEADIRRIQVSCQHRGMCGHDDLPAVCACDVPQGIQENALVAGMLARLRFLDCVDHGRCAPVGRRHARRTHSATVRTKRRTPPYLAGVEPPVSSRRLCRPPQGGGGLSRVSEFRLRAARRRRRQSPDPGAISLPTGSGEAAGVRPAIPLIPSFQIHPLP